MPIRCKNKKGQFAKCSTKTKRVRVASAPKTARKTAGRAFGYAAGHAFKKGDIVKYKSSFLKSVQWYTNVPIDGLVTEVDRELVTVKWSDGHTNRTHAANIMHAKKPDYSGTSHGRAGRAGGVASAKASAHVKSREAFLRAARRAAGAEANLRVEIVPGASAPKIMGEGAHYRTSGGTLIRHPGAYSKKGFGNMVYKHTTRRVVVGSEWNPTGHASGKRSTKRTSAQWWAWHDKSIPTTQGARTMRGHELFSSMEEADAACAAWVAGKSNVGPSGHAAGSRHHVQPGDRVTYVNYRGTKMSGRVVMRSSEKGSWVVNTGGRYGTPDVVSEEQIISVRKSPSGRSIG